MSTEGLSTARLGRLHDVMVGHVERGDVPGIVTLVCWRRGVHREYSLAHLQPGQESPAEGVANGD
jgi:hypothetical protein